jgi:hypothetical protein
LVAKTGQNQYILNVMFWDVSEDEPTVMPSVIASLFKVARAEL